MTFKDIKSSTHEVSTFALKSLIYDYVYHKCKKHIIETHYEFNGNEDAAKDDPEYQVYNACCETAEEWMRAIGISPDNILIKKLYYENIIDKMKEEIEEDKEGR